MGETYIGADEIRDHAQRSALAGRGIWCNPHVGDDAARWAAAYREVPEAQRGSQPQLLTSFRTVHARTRKSVRGRAIGKGVFDGAIRAEVDEAEARTPKPWATEPA